MPDTFQFQLNQKHLGLVFDTPLEDDRLLISHFTFNEALSTPFHGQLSLLSDMIDVDPTKVLGKPVTITLHPRPLRTVEPSDADKKAQTRHFHGIVDVFRSGAAIQDARSQEGGFRAYYAEIVPQFGMLQYTTDCRIFQEKTVIEIIEAVLQDHKLSANRDYSTSDVSGPLSKRKWDYCVQYNESDFQFLSRLMEEVGIYYYFDHTDSNHKLVLTDEKAPSVKTHDMVFRTSSRRAFDINEITSWENRFRFHAGNVAFSDFDYRETAVDLTVAEATSKGHAETKAFEVYEYSVPYQSSKFDVYGTKADGKQLAKIHMEVLDSERHVVHATSRFREITPIHVVKIVEQMRGTAPEDNKFLVVSVVHEMEQDPLPRTRTRSSQLNYSNSFTCLPSSTPYRPPQTTPKPRMAGPQTAIVIGAQAFDASNKADQEVMTDKLGRVKVQFPWDRRLATGEKKYENCSCWIRVAQGAAGAGWGIVHVPRKGEEVIVEFFNGNPNEPIITGRVYNAQNKHPYALHDSKPHVVLVDDSDNKSYLSGFKSCSGLEGDPTKNYNELRFQDRKGKEHVYFHAEKDFVRVVENRDVLIVSDKETITDKRTEKLLDDTKDGSQSIEIYKHRITTIWTGDEKLTVEEGDRTVTVKKNDHHEIEEGHRTSLISKGDDKIEVTKGDRIVEIKSGQHTFDVAKDFTITAGKNINVEAKNDKIELVVGLSSLTMKKDGTITLKGKAITIDAMQTVKVKALQKVDIEGTMGVSQKGLQYGANGQLKAAMEGSVMAEVKGGAMAKVKGGVTFVN